MHPHTEPHASAQPGTLDRRQFLRRTAATGAAVALPGWLLSACGETTGGGTSAGAGTVVKATHGTGLCNLGIFLTKERDLADGVDLRFVVTPTNADIVTLFGAGQVDASLIPYSQLMSVHDNGAPVTIVAGGGVEGCVVCAQPGINSATDLKGKTLGTFQADTLEMLALDYLQKAGLDFKDVKVKYFGTSPELAQAFINGSIDSMSHIEPYATQALAARKGSVKLSNGLDVYMPGYTDCVLGVRNELLQKNPKAVKALIKGLMVAQQQAEKDREAAVRLTTPKYYKASLADVLDASKKQPNVVDQRGDTQFMLDRGKNLQALGYIKKPLTRSLFDYSLLEEVIAENSGLYKSLDRRYAA